MIAAVYLPEYSEKHRTILKNFAGGLGRCGVRVIFKSLSLGFEKTANIHVIFGSYKYSYPVTMPKKDIIDKCKDRQLIMIESGFCKRGEFYQVGFNGFAGDANFRNNHSPPDRWEAMHIKTKPWQKRHGPVVVCGQVPHDTQVQDMNHIAWCKETVRYYQKRKIPVVFRPHPRVKDPTIYGIPFELWDLAKIRTTLEYAKCFVTWNSTSSVDALIAGVPVITRHRSSISWPIASHKFELENLYYPSRRQFFANLGYAQWTVEEMREGLPWRHLSR